ncbi:XisI protein [Fibrella sp. HMF5335]|uniref:XisI protein n=1 Tax=Fibrella rubiginis TaxID=2817060 RepID=A0A939GEJ6_9BACT|nr:XisI protein [Fibrella rubiginis]MBO0937677.1 XisI protein [Fibrella rubiginis]
MDKLTHYRQLIRSLMTEYAGFKPKCGQIDSELIIDKAENHFQVVRVGWLNKHRIHGASLHLDIIGDKIWIQHDSTDSPIADELVEAGVFKEDIVLAFQPEDIRPYTGFAVR